jgi:hypothetical protein
VSKQHRINLELGPNSYRALKALQASLESASQAETLRFALQTLAKLVEETRDGGRVVIERKNGDVVQVLLPGVNAAAVPADDAASTNVHPLRRKAR